MYVLNFQTFVMNSFDLCVGTDLRYCCVNVLRFQNFHLYYVWQIASTHHHVMGMWYMNILVILGCVLFSFFF